MKKTSKMFIGLILTAGVILLALPVSSVFAQGEEPPQVETEEPDGILGLEALFAKEVERYEKAEEGIINADEAVAKLKRRIETLIERGKDPSGLQDILDAFLNNLYDVEDIYVEVGELIENHVGFDSDGKVVDEGLAVYTLRQIAEGLLDVHQLAEDARFELRWDLMHYRYSLRNAD